MRTEAAHALAGLEPQLPDSVKGAFAKALQEYIDIQMFNADRPESWTNLGTLYGHAGGPDAGDECVRPGAGARLELRAGVGQPGGLPAGDR